MGQKRIEVVEQSQTGRNKIFRDTESNIQMTRKEFVKKIKEGKYPDYTIAKINNIPTPKAKPDKNKNNNLG